MKIKQNWKYLLLFVILIVSQISCEIDDICLDGGTPQLIVRFCDEKSPADTIIFKKPLKLFIGAVKEKDTLYKGVSLDSLVLPLNTAKNLTSFWLETNDDKKVKDIITLKYDKEDVFVSKSCGYKTIFKNVKKEKTGSWIKKMILKSTNIENEKKAHLYIYF